MPNDMPVERCVTGRAFVPFSCIPHILQHQAERIPDAPAILAPGRAALTYGLLYQHIDKIVRALRAAGIGRRDRVAVLVPNGPEMAVAILSVEACAVCVPLNPAYGTEELERSFADLQLRALITQAGIQSPARRVALSRGVRILELYASADAEVGVSTLTGDRVGTPADEPVRPGDVALLLPTSGTTSRPKVVPLTHANICTSAYATVTALGLTETDRCLNIMPLFHGHGLNATVLASLAAGASVVCTSGCDVNSFFAWLIAFQPTWYSAVPTMHQAILAQAQHNRERVANTRLRFMRSSSAPLPPRICKELEQTFGTPVIEYYGLTETASAPVACNPLPPHVHKPGSVGIPVGLDVAIMDESGFLLPRGHTGQIVVRGASVMSGYDGDTVATQAAFAGDWFKTGDHGFFDDDGYLFLVGRKQEIINRGGEKIAPREIDEVLLDHPAVMEAAAFAVPHPTLGQDVGAAVVLRPDAAATARSIRQFAIGRVADFKIPRQIVIVSELPKGPTGKVQRVGLAAKLGLASQGALPRIFVAPQTPIESMLAAIWAETFQLERVGVHDDFFALGGDSLLATEFLSRVHDTIGLDIEVSRFFEAPTIAEIAGHLEALIPANQGEQPVSAITRAPRESELPASVSQERLWKLHHALPFTPFFNVLDILRVTSALDTTVLERSINEIVRRHEILRTNFATIDGRCVQVIAPRLTVHLTCDDLCELPESRKQAAGLQCIQEEVLHWFDLVRGPLFRTRLVQLGDQEHLLLITIHQIIGDGWSLGVLVDELTALYDAFSAREASPLTPLHIQYGDFANWQRHWRSHPEIVAQLDYWREQLHEPLPPIGLAKGKPKQPIDAFRTTRRELALPADLSEAAKRFGMQERCTLFMTLVAALKTLLHRYLGQDDLRVATVVANRNRPGTESIIGPLVNTVLLRTNLGGDPSPREVMRRVRATTLLAFAHQDLPFEELVETLELERDLEPAALSQVMITLHNASLRPIASSRQSITLEEANRNVPMPLATVTSCDIILMLHECTDGLVGSCVYKPHLFDVKTIDRLLQDFQGVLEQIVTQPERPISAIRVSPSESYATSD